MNHDQIVAIRAGRTEESSGSRKEEARLHPAWLRLFEYVRGMGEGTLDRLVIQDRTPVFMERTWADVDLTGDDLPPFMQVSAAPSALRHGPEWTNLIAIAGKLAYCEFHRIRVEGGAPVSIGAVVNKEKLA
ncbi:MAG: hypothetical protein HQK87_05495 [Nitrospinae bacterium]|nr:hypothetical protein [Nitrospinota bacterium]